ncbi:MFS transporter [Streptomyces sp. TM32]|uniref:MFS transporter n=1 Tax=Streptomyces sp. TM32 TaxID=1652669 RepID=UPI0020B1153A|nr:MFS transporter [Streptomyces sp. TM32]
MYGITAAVGAFLAGGLCDLWGPRRVMMAGALCWAVCHTLLLAVAVPAHSYGLILLTYGLRGFGYPLFAYGFMVWIMVGAPERQLGKALGWFWFCFTMGYPVIGSALVSALKPAIGFYRTLWVSLAMIVAGALVVLLLLRERTGFQGLSRGPERVGLPRTFLGCFTVLFDKPRVGMGAVVRLINHLAVRCVGLPPALPRRPDRLPRSGVGLAADRHDGQQPRLRRHLRCAR